MLDFSRDMNVRVQTAELGKVLQTVKERPW